MYTSENIVGVEEFVGGGVFAIHEANTRKLTSFNATVVIWFMSEPMDPEELHVLSLHMT
jgi:hypothetical protein